MEKLVSNWVGAWEYLWGIFAPFKHSFPCDLSERKLTRDSENCQPPADKFYRGIDIKKYKPSL